MDPNEALRLLRLTVKQMRVDTDPGVRKAHADEIAEYFEALDEWLTKGGFLPQDWLFRTTDRDPEDINVRPTATCGCGFTLVWVEGRWQHDAAPSLWGGDHDADEPAPTGPAREHWDQQDCVTD